MATKLSALISRAQPTAQPADECIALGDLCEQLNHWFGAQFSLFDGETGDPLVGDGLVCPTRDSLVLGEMCRAVAAGGRAEIVEERDPLMLLAIPVQASPRQSVTAVAAFVTSAVATTAQVDELATTWGLSHEAVRTWLAEQQVWQPSVLLNMGQLAAERLMSERKLQTLERDVRDLTFNLSSTYEEISLIYRLTQNLKLTSRSSELAALAIEWLSEVVAADCLAVQLIPSETTAAETGRSTPQILTYGECPIASDEITELLEQFDLQADKRPLIVNDPANTMPFWPWPEVHGLIAVPLCEGSHCFGWLLAINNSFGGEFGTVEASLLSSVAAILGIHGGNAELYEQQQQLFKGMVRALTSAIDAKDPYTCGHSERVARVAVRLAEELGCDREQIDTIYLSGLLHDIGKIGIDDNVLRKPGKLTEAEYEHIKLHAEIGHHILCDIKQLGHVLPVVLHHHEQWNGSGYPHHLAGEAIPLLARIVGVADSFDAMSSDRPYRAGMPDEKLDEIFRAGAGQQWDARVIDAFFRVRDDMRAIANRDATPPPTADRREFV